MDESTFAQFRSIVHAHSGIALSDGKKELVRARVGKRMRVLGIEEHRKYLQFVKKDESGAELVHLLDAISTNVTSFYRGPAHFKFLGEAASKWLAAGQTRFRFWSAACSTGEEPYSMAMELLNVFKERKVDLRILATDLCTDVLETCRLGRYNEKKIEVLSGYLSKRYFLRKMDRAGICYQIRDIVKNLVLFRRLNLSCSPFPMRGPMDVIFCRNVMIYFDADLRKQLLNEMYRLLKPGGYLMVGQAESLTGMMSEFKSVEPSIYIKQ